MCVLALVGIISSIISKVIHQVKKVYLKKKQTNKKTGCSRIKLYHLCFPFKQIEQKLHISPYVFLQLFSMSKLQFQVWTQLYETLLMYRLPSHPQVFDTLIETYSFSLQKQAARELSDLRVGFQNWICMTCDTWLLQLPNH